MKPSLQSNASSVIVIIKRSREPLSLATAEAPPTSLWKQVQPISICSELLWKPALCSCVKPADVSPIWSEQSQQYVNVCSRRGPKVAIKSGLLGTRDCFERLGNGLSTFGYFLFLSLLEIRGVAGPQALASLPHLHIWSENVFHQSLVEVVHWPAVVMCVAEDRLLHHSRARTSPGGWGEHTAVYSKSSAFFKSSGTKLIWTDQQCFSKNPTIVSMHLE